jgi:hypothetical protein
MMMMGIAQIDTADAHMKKYVLGLMPSTMCSQAPSIARAIAKSLRIRFHPQSDAVQSQTILIAKGKSNATAKATFTPALTTSMTRRPWVIVTCSLLHQPVKQRSYVILVVHLCQRSDCCCLLPLPLLFCSYAALPSRFYSYIVPHSKSPPHYLSSSLRRPETSSFVTCAASMPASPRAVCMARFCFVSLSSSFTSL